MKQRLYIDTSVFGGYYDEEFEESPNLFLTEYRKMSFYSFFQRWHQDELENAPIQVRELVKHLKVDFTEFVEITEEAVELAMQYIKEKVVGQTSYADCLHIALATIHHANFLVSWNFKHIVNVQKIMGYNSINIKNGYKQLEIRSPRDFIKYEDDNW